MPPEREPRNRERRNAYSLGTAAMINEASEVLTRDEPVGIEIQDETEEAGVVGELHIKKVDNGFVITVNENMPRLDRKVFVTKDLIELRDIVDRHFRVNSE